MTEEARILLEDIFPFGRVLVTREGQVYDVNKQARAIFQFSENDLTGVSLEEYIAPKYWQSFRRFLDKVFTSKRQELLDIKLTHINPDYPTDVCVFGHLVPFGDLCQLTVMDISASHRVPRVIDENIGQFRFNLLEKTTWRSKKHAQILGIQDPTQEWSLEVALQYVVPEDVNKVMESFKRGVEQGIDESIEFRIKRTDGVIRWIWLTTSVTRSSEGMPVIVDGIIQDITEMRRNQIDLLSAEERYFNLISMLEIGVVILGPDERVLVCNPSALRLFGLTMEQMIGGTAMNPAWNVIHPDGSPYPGDTHPVSITFKTGKPVLNAIMGVFRPVTQDRIWISINSEPRFNYDGSIKDVTATFKDVTEIVRANGVTR